MKVVKFGGSSMADANQYRKVRDILLADPERRVVVVSAAGKRNSQDHKITDLLYLCHAHTQYGVDCSNIFEMIRSRYLEIRDELGIDLDLETEFAALKSGLDRKMVSQDELASRGEYFSAKLMAAYLGFAFVDAVLVGFLPFAHGVLNRSPRSSATVGWRAMGLDAICGRSACSRALLTASPNSRASRAVPKTTRRLNSQ